MKILKKVNYVSIILFIISLLILVACSNDKNSKLNEEDSEETEIENNIGDNPADITESIIGKMNQAKNLDFEQVKDYVIKTYEADNMKNALMATQDILQFKEYKTPNLEYIKHESESGIIYEESIDHPDLFEKIEDLPDEVEFGYIYDVEGVGLNKTILGEKFDYISYKFKKYENTNQYKCTFATEYKNRSEIEKMYENIYKVLCKECGETFENNDGNKCVWDFTSCGEITLDIDNLYDDPSKAMLNLIFEDYSRTSEVYIMGKYEQDNNISNGKEDIEWIILEKDDNKMFVVSKYGLLYKPFNDEKSKLTWETSSLRKWLNNEFINEAFNKKEQNKIIITNVINCESWDYDLHAQPLNDTQDKIFLMSCDEMKFFYMANLPSACYPTKYADPEYWYDGEAKTHKSVGAKYWLRTPTIFRDRMWGCYGSGLLQNNLNQLEDYLVRPAMWVSIE